ncbi:hypothetical protein BOTBODRAFT_105546 [Botryobasidium botryosum FD-172 SS1]|uniref:Protein YOP1 n=1 Tax=Botryobasidium botryosum (strain FD-172 SS1) TaxID=930990 RepID=A0A067N004_BOTB1|nr:hypothetical protein BOTBODRAFT_105546 [Botryobasidium botryosum FD-172 SS1]
MSNHPAVVHVQKQASYYVSQIDKELSKYPVANQLEAKTQVPKAYAAIGSAALLGLLLFVNALALPVSNLIGWALPAYLSFKAIESPQHEDDVQWLTYWAVFGLFNFIESVALRIVLFYFPFYFVFKTAFILWLQLPATRGARTVYTAFVRPVLVQQKRTVPAAHPAPPPVPSHVDLQ